MRSSIQLAFVLLVGVLLLPGLASAADGTLSLRMDDDERLFVYIDGEEVGKTPLELTLSPGRYNFELKVAEYSIKSVKGSGVVRSGQTTAMVGSWASGTFTEDFAATRGTIEVTLSLASAIPEALPVESGVEFWPQLRTVASCGEEELPASSIKVTEIEGSPLSRLVTVESVLPVECQLGMSLWGVEASTTHAVQAQQTSTAEATLELSWALLSVVRVNGGDSAQLVRQDDQGKESTTSLSSKPHLVASGPGRVVLQHSGKALEIADLADVAGSVIVDPYGTLVFPEAVQVEGVALTINGATRKLSPELLLPVGEWTVGLSAPGTHPMERTVAIVSGESSRWTGTLSGVAPAQVAFRVAGPEQWQLSINGKQAESAESLELPPGKYSFEVSSAGWSSKSEELELAEGQQAALDFELSADPISVRFTPLVSDSKVILTDEAGKATEATVAGEHEVELAVGRYSWRVEAKDRSPAEGSFELKPADSAHEISVQQPWTELALAQRSTKVRSAVLAGLAGALAGAGVAFIVDGQDLYGFAAEQHDTYLAQSDPDDILWAKSLRDDSIDLGKTYEGVGWALVGAAAGVTAGAVISAIVGTKKANEMSAALVPTQEGAVFALTGRW
jgi:hypothetical protein